MAGSALAPKTMSPIFLTNKTPDQSIKNLVQSKLSLLDSANILGGEGVIPTSILEELLNKSTAIVGESTENNMTNTYRVLKDGDWIYYINASDSRSLYKIKIDGTGKTKLNSRPSVDSNIIGDWIIYISNMKTYRIRLDGTFDQQLP